MLIGIGVASAWWWARPAAPDAFYLPPSSVPMQPGILLRSEPFMRGAPAGARGWRILYTTTLDAGTPALASGIVLAPARASSGPLPVVAWAHGTTGVVPGCGPSQLEDYLDSGGLPALAQVVERGWVLVATDYPGMGTSGTAPYLIGEGEARAVLDSVRAVRQFEGIEVSAQTIVWGHSQGGHSALWTGILAPTYAPDVPLTGVAALAPATDLISLVREAQGTPIGAMISAFVVRAYADFYPDVRPEDVVRRSARLLSSDIAGRCLAGPKTLVSVVEALALGGLIFAGDPGADGPLARRLMENTPLGMIPSPLLIGQGLTDELVRPSIQAAYVQARCAAGQRLEYRTYGGRDHMQLVQESAALADDLIRWTHERFDGLPQAAGCHAVEW